MSDTILIETAIKLGYLKAKVIKPAHLLDKDRKVTIPKDSAIIKTTDGLTFIKDNLQTFPDTKLDEKWFGLIYSYSTGKWAEILESYPDDYPVLRNFPDDGVCWSLNKELVKFLESKYEGGLLLTKSSKGVAWSKNSTWSVSTSSSKPEYQIEQLRPFFPNKYAINPLTPEECFFPDKWCIDVTAENQHYVQDFLVWKQAEYINYRHTWKPTTGDILYYPQGTFIGFGTSNIDNVREGYTKITTKQLVKEVFLKELEEKPIKQQENGRSIKVQRFDLTVRDTGTIRAIGVKCPKIQIKVGSGHLPD